MAQQPMQSVSTDLRMVWPASKKGAHDTTLSSRSESVVSLWPTPCVQTYNANTLYSWEHRWCTWGSVSMFVGRVRQRAPWVEMPQPPHKQDEPTTLGVCVATDAEAVHAILQEAVAGWCWWGR